MPWQEVIAVELRHQFVQDALRRLVPLTELCAAYGVSRKTGYKFSAPSVLQRPGPRRLVGSESGG